MKKALIIIGAVLVLGGIGAAMSKGEENTENDSTTTSSATTTITDDSDITSDATTTEAVAEQEITTAEETTQPIVAKENVYIVYWGNSGDKIHIDPNCRTLSNGVLSGTIDECKAAGHTEGWCGVCSKNWTDEKFYENGNPYAE